ncbi:MAG: inorganic diphosphatase [Proteobacteria bacterium]|nr:inorganic diphosphatase [Pseudomonadota bacterium]
MAIENVITGKNPPEDVYVIIENPRHSAPVKYEMDKDTGVLFVDRFTPTPMFFPAHYGYIPHTLGGDGDPVDAFVVTDIDVVPGCVIRARPVAVLVTEDESGMDEKVVCVPHTKLDRRFEKIKDVNDLEDLLKDQMKHFYENYKGLESGKWVKVTGWEGVDTARKVIADGVARLKKGAA